MDRGYGVTARSASPELQAGLNAYRDSYARSRLSVGQTATASRSDLRVDAQGIEPSAVVPQDPTFGIVGYGQLQEGIDCLRIARINVRVVGREDQVAPELLHQVERRDLVWLNGYDTLP